MFLIVLVNFNNLNYLYQIDIKSHMYKKTHKLFYLLNYFDFALISEYQPQKMSFYFCSDEPPCG